MWVMAEPGPLWRPRHLRRGKVVDVDDDPIQ